MKNPSALLLSYLSCQDRKKEYKKLTYCLPLGSGYLNRQSATIFIFRHSQHNKERPRWLKETHKFSLTNVIYNIDMAYALSIVFHKVYHSISFAFFVI